MTNFWESEGYQKPEEELLPENRFQLMLYELMEHPESSLLARILAFLSVFVIIV
jgi:hypothetical protein